MRYEDVKFMAYLDNSLRKKKLEKIWRVEVAVSIIYVDKNTVLSTIYIFCSTLVRTSLTNLTKLVFFSIGNVLIFNMEGV